MFAVLFFIGLALFLLGFFTAAHILFVLGIVGMVVGGVGWIATAAGVGGRRRL